MGSQSSSSLLLWLLSTLRPRLMLMLMPTTAPWATTVWATPTTDTMDSGPMLPPPTTVSGLTAMLPPTPMAPTGTSARGLLMLSPRLMLMLTTALWATTVWLLQLRIQRIQVLRCCPRLQLRRQVLRLCFPLHLQLRYLRQIPVLSNTYCPPKLSNQKHQDTSYDEDLKFTILFCKV